MPKLRTVPRRLAVTALWPFGIAATSWSYMWRTTPLHRREVHGSLPDDAAPDLPPDVDNDDLQPATDGVGDLFHRRYRVSIADARLSPVDLIETIAADPNRVAPTEFARFVKVEGDDDTLVPGDELVVRMPGPWDGPVRVVDRTPTSFRLATLSGHLEAGQIEFSAATDGDRLLFTVESWARSGDRFSKVLYTQLHMAKEVQFHMWTSVLEHAVTLAGGRMTGGIDVETRRVDEPAAAGDPPLGDPSARKLLDALHDKGLNFEVGERRDFTADRGWHVDNYCQPLPSEPPGPPVSCGSWEVAQRLMRDYEFADPSIVRAVYHPDRSLDDRDMLLEARFHGLRFKLGVRVGGVRDEVRDIDGRQVRVWGWNYRTLQGHLEMGQMDYEVWKWLDSGEVEFRISAFSRRATTGNPIVRLGVPHLRSTRAGALRPPRLYPHGRSHRGRPERQHTRRDAPRRKRGGRSSTVERVWLTGDLRLLMVGGTGIQAARGAERAQPGRSLLEQSQAEATHLYGLVEAALVGGLDGLGHGEE